MAREGVWRRESSFMPDTFRIAIGPCRCAGRRLRGIRSEVCGLVLQRLQAIRSLGPRSLAALPLEEGEALVVSGHPVDLYVIRKPLVGECFLVVVSAFVHTLRWPTYWSASRIGHVLAEGLVVGPDGTVTDASDEHLWRFR